MSETTVTENNSQNFPCETEPEDSHDTDLVGCLTWQQHVLTKTAETVDPEPGPPIHVTTPPVDAVSPFKETTALLFQVVAGRVEEGWSTRTFCGRPELNNGSEIEVQAMQQAIAQWSQLAHHVPYTITVPRNNVKKYNGGGYTGIDAGWVLKFYQAQRTLVRAQTTFPLYVVANREVLDPARLEAL